MIISIGSDHAGFKLKESLISFLKEKNYLVKDVGCYNEELSDYPDLASIVCNDIINKASDYGILICGTGIGMSIAANRNNSIRAALCCNEFMAEKAREHNDANIIVFGSRIISENEAKKMLEKFLDTAFEGGRHLSRLNKI